MFIAFSSTATQRDVHPQIFSPTVMQWDENVWLVNLSSCAAYWDVQAKVLGCKAEELYRLILNKHFGERGYRAVLAAHPWQAVLLCEHMQERELSGLVYREDVWGARFYRELSWSSWWKTIDSLSKHYDAMRYRGFCMVKFKQYTKRMQMTVERLGSGAPWELQTVGAAAVQRRYGRLMRDVWEWSFAERASDMRAEFPWKGWQEATEIKINRHLDELQNHWEGLAEFFREDLHRLCQLCEQRGWQKIVSLEWRLKLSDLSYLPIPIHFRHPYAPHLECPTYTTAVLQAHYSFEREMRALDDAHQKNIHEKLLIWVVGWELELKKALCLPAQVRDLFGASTEDEMLLLELENKLPLPLFEYELCHDWSLEESFAVHQREQGSVRGGAGLLPEALSSLEAIAKRRPLFLLRQKESIKAAQKKSSALWQFRERTMSKWWKGAGVSSEAICGDFYRYVDADQRALWVCRQDSERWYVHGIFA